MAEFKNYDKWVKGKARVISSGGGFLPGDSYALATHSFNYMNVLEISWGGNYHLCFFDDPRRAMHGIQRLLVEAICGADWMAHGNFTMEIDSKAKTEVALDWDGNSLDMPWSAIKHFNSTKLNLMAMPQSCCDMYRKVCQMSDIARKSGDERLAILRSNLLELLADKVYCALVDYFDAAKELGLGCK